MKATTELLGSLFVDLPELLGNDYEILEGPAAAELFNLGRDQGMWIGDVLVRNKVSGDLIIVEVKGSKPDDELPFGVLPGLRRAKRLSDQFHSKLVLVSTSIVSPPLRHALTSEGIVVVENPSPARVAEEIRSIAEAGIAAV
jgi:hypothetical protein